MPVLTNPRHEYFAALVASGVTATKAYELAGFRGKGAAPSASRLAKNPVVADRIVELRSSISSAMVTRAVVDREWVIKELMDNVHRAKEGEFDGATANRALELLGKHLGMFTDRSVQAPWDGDLSKLSGEQLARLMPILEQIADEQKYPAAPEVPAELPPPAKTTTVQ